MSSLSSVNKALKIVIRLCGLVCLTLKHVLKAGLLLRLQNFIPLAKAMSQEEKSTSP